MKVSIALCTYNGQQYLAQQLDSFFIQTVLPDEIVAFDDGSSDGTLNILESYAVRYPAVHWKINRNAVNLRAPRNFEQAVAACTGDLIFLSDQDDVWEPLKVERVRAFFREHPKDEAVFTDASLIDDDGAFRPGTMLDHSFFTIRARKSFTKEQLLTWSLLLGNVITGATMAIRASALPLVLPFHLRLRRTLWHDGWIGFALLGKGVMGFIDEPLIRYRVHRQQQVGLPEVHDAFERCVVEDRQEDAAVSVKTYFENYLTAVLFMRDLQAHTPITLPVAAGIVQQYLYYKRAYFHGLPLLARKFRLLKWFLMRDNDISLKDLVSL